MNDAYVFGAMVIGALIVIGAYFIHKRAKDNPVSSGSPGAGDLKEGKGKGTKPELKK